jgi:hypothetical protein
MKYWRLLFILIISIPLVGCNYCDRKKNIHRETIKCKLVNLGIKDSYSYKTSASFFVVLGYYETEGRTFQEYKFYAKGPNELVRQKSFNQNDVFIRLDDKATPSFECSMSYCHEKAIHSNPNFEPPTKILTIPNGAISHEINIKERR